VLYVVDASVSPRLLSRMSPGFSFTIVRNSTHRGHGGLQGTSRIVLMHGACQTRKKSCLRTWPGRAS